MAGHREGLRAAEGRHAASCRRSAAGAGQRRWVAGGLAAGHACIKPGLSACLRRSAWITTGWILSTTPRCNDRVSCRVLELTNLPRLEVANMRQLSVTALALTVSSLLCACATGRSTGP